MEPNTPNTEPISSSPRRRKPKAGKVLALILVILLLVGGAAAGSYYYRDNQAKRAEKKSAAEIQSLQTEVKTLQTAAKSSATTTAQTSTACTPVQPSASAVENIKASITSGNTAALEGYMGTSVNVLYAASDGIASRTPTQAVSDVTSFIGSSTVVWAFNIPASTLSSYGQGSYGKYFPGTAVVGKSSQDKVLSFNFDCNGKISTVFMAAQESSLK